jgi:hypothetical protein
MDLTGTGFGESEDFSDILQSETLVIEHVQNLLLDVGEHLDPVADLLMQFPLKEHFRGALLIQVRQLP